MGSSVQWPDERVVGAASRVVALGDGSDGLPTVGVEYDSGIRLIVVPSPDGSWDMAEVQASRRDKIKWADGRRDEFDVRTIAGRQTAVQLGGRATVRSGNASQTTDVLPVVQFYSNGMQYVFKVTSDKVGVDRLLSAAGTVR